ncbi:ROK family protein [Arthrobacter sp. D1-29]
MTCSLGVDIGGTKIASAVLDRDGTVLDVHTTPTARGGDVILGQVAAIVNGVAAKHDLSGIGIAVPGDVNPSTGIIRSAPNIGWSDLDIAEHVRSFPPAGAAVRVDNDANAAAWAEYRFGGHPRTDSFAMITVGTGLGGGFIINGRLLCGATGAAGEVGHLALVPGGDSCPCGSRGCWERYASGSALHRAAVAAGWDEGSAGHDVLAAAEIHPPARRVVEGVARDLTRGILLLASALDPSLVILGGGLGSDPRFLAIAQEAMAGAEVTPPRSRPQLRTAVLGPIAGAIGAADLSLAPPDQNAEPSQTNPSVQFRFHHEGAA